MKRKQTNNQIDAAISWFILISTVGAVLAAVWTLLTI